MRVAIIGAGYVGLTTGACLAELGHAVTCIDVDQKRITALRRGEIPIYEPGLEALVRRGREAGRLGFSGAIVEGVGEADVIFLAVGTPPDINGDIDLSYVEAGARQLAPHIRPNATVVIKSTVVAGTCRWLREIIAEERGGLDFSVASNPEFLREGSAIADFMQPDRIVIGSDDPLGAAALQELYEPLSRRDVPVITTSTANAELIKYAANAFLALKIGFINDVADLCEKVDGDVGVVAEGIGLDRRIGRAFLAAGPGFGGSCFPKDTRAFIAMGRKHEAPQGLIETLVARNDERKRGLAARILAEVATAAGEPVVTVLGLAFKANTDDMREAPSLAIIPLLQKAGVRVQAHDPQAARMAARHLPGVALFDDPYAAARGADAVVILTEWEQYRTVELARLTREMRGRIIMDFRNVLSPQAANKHGFRYIRIGRPAEPAPAAPVKLLAPRRRARAATGSSSA